MQPKKFQVKNKTKVCNKLNYIKIPSKKFFRLLFLQVVIMFAGQKTK